MYVWLNKGLGGSLTAHCAHAPEERPPYDLGVVSSHEHERQLPLPIILSFKLRDGNSIDAPGFVRVKCLLLARCCFLGRLLRHVLGHDGWAVVTPSWSWESGKADEATPCARVCVSAEGIMRIYTIVLCWP